MLALLRFRQRKKQPRSRKYQTTESPCQADTTSSSETDSQSDSLPYLGEDTTGRVRFAEESVHLIEAVTDASLWWSEPELEQIRLKCARAIEGCEGTDEIGEALSDYLAMGFDGESVEAASSLMELMSIHEQTRGLEQFCTEERNAAMEDHRYNVLTTQDLLSCPLVAGMKDRDEALRAASLRVSRGTESLAYRKAQHDSKATEQSRKRSLSC